MMESKQSIKCDEKDEQYEKACGYNRKQTGRIIKELRKKKAAQDNLTSLTQESAAEAMELKLTTYQSIEQGRKGASADTLKVIAEYYNVTIDYLITGKEDNLDMKEGRRTALVGMIDLVIFILQNVKGVLET